MAGSNGEGASGSEGRTAPDFTRETVSGETFTLSHHRGEVVVLNFWATWCPPCRAEIPDFVELQDEYADADLHFVGVTVDVDDVDLVRKYARHFRINYPLIHGDGSLVEKYGGVGTVPTSFIIDRSGEIRYRVPGRIPKDMLRSVLDKLLDA